VNIMSNYIPLGACKPRFVYRVHSRNISIGVFNPDTNGFIGIRYKFDAEYLFTEYHWDTGSPYGTVKPKELLEKIPDDIELRERLGDIDKSNGRSVFYDKTPDENGNGTQDGGDDENGNRITIKVRGWCYTDTNEYVQERRNVVSVENKKLFDYLKALWSSLPKEQLEESEDI
jgi:hypothetical protein